MTQEYAPGSREPNTGISTNPLGSLLSTIQVDTTNPKPKRSKSLKPEGTELRMMLDQIDLRFRYDTRNGTDEVAFPQPHLTFDADVWYPLDHNVMKVVTAYAEDALAPAKIGTEALEKAIGSMAQRNSYDPFLVEYIEQLKWDEQERLEWLLHNCFDFVEEDDEIPYNYERARHFGPLVFGTAVGRALSPGMKADITPILVGPGGIGKSTFVECLVPDPKWFGYFDFSSLQHNRAHEHTAGHVILEMPEMSGLRQVTLSTVKSFMTRARDDYRLPYARRVQRVPRTWSMVGTANSMFRLFYDDDAFMRRFMPVKVSGSSTEGYERVVTYLRANLDQLWAEAAVRFRTGYDGITKDVAKMIFSLPDTVRQTHFTVDLINDLDDEDIHYRSIDEIADQSDYARHLRAGDRQRLGALLRKRGFRKKQVRRDGNRRDVWVKDDMPAPTLDISDAMGAAEF